MGPRGVRTGRGEGFTTRNLIVYAVTRVIKFGRLGWAGYVARMKEVELLSKFITINLQERDL